MAAPAPSQSTDPSPPTGPDPSSPTTQPGTWVIVGASRGIGLEFVRQLLSQGHQVIAAVRDPVAKANQLWQIAGAQARPGSCLIEQCDVVDEASIKVGLLQSLCYAVGVWTCWGHRVLDLVRFEADKRAGFCRQVEECGREGDED